MLYTLYIVVIQTHIYLSSEFHHFEYKAIVFEALSIWENILFSSHDTFHLLVIT